ELNRYHWFVLIVAALGWLFDCMDQRIFMISRQRAMTELLGYQFQQEKWMSVDGKALTKAAQADAAEQLTSLGYKIRGGMLTASDGSPLTSSQYVAAMEQLKRLGLTFQERGVVRLDGTTLTRQEQIAAKDEIDWYMGVATAVFMIGWATGGLFFGIMGDRWGRARTMLLTIVIYSMFTGLTALSQFTWDFMAYRLLTGMGVGGEFAAGVALLAEVMPARARPYALGLLQALSAVGNITGSLLSWGLANWRYLFVAGILPALLVGVVLRRLKEP